MTKKVHILGNGGAAQKHRQTYNMLSDKFELVESYFEADIIDICTPNYLHFTQIMTALNCYKSVFVEKPLCGSLAELDVIETKVTDSMIPVALLPIFQHRIQISGITERLYHRDSNYYSGWRGKWETALGGVLVSHAIHDIHAIALDVCKHDEKDIVAVECDILEHGPNGLDSRVEIAISFTDKSMAYLDIGITTVPGEEKNPLKASIDDYILEFDRALEGVVQWDAAALTMDIVTACYQSVIKNELVFLPELQMTPNSACYQGWTQPILQLQRNTESFLRKPA